MLGGRAVSLAPESVHSVEGEQIINLRRIGRVLSGVAVVGILVFIGVTQTAEAVSWQEQKRLPMDGDQYDYFGNSVSVSGTTGAIGARGNDHCGMDSGSAYIFEPVPEPATLTLLGMGAFGLFGYIRRQRMK